MKVFREASEQAARRTGTETNQIERIATSKGVERGESVAGMPLQEDDDEVVVTDLDLSVIDQVRNTWQLCRDRRPDAYDEIFER